MGPLTAPDGVETSEKCVWLSDPQNDLTSKIVSLKKSLHLDKTYYDITIYIQ